MVSGSPYDPFSPYAGRGRFGDGTVLVLYVADTSAAATAEYFRRHIKLIERQQYVRLTVYELSLTIAGRVLDVRSPGQAASVNIPYDRLTANDADEDLRYAETRALAHAVRSDGHGIAFPSAAWNADGAWCLALFNDPSPEGWAIDNYVTVDTPLLDPADVVAVPAS